MLRYSCLIFGILLALLFLTLLITCRTIGLPIRHDGWEPGAPAAGAATYAPSTINWYR